MVRGDTGASSTKPGTTGTNRKRSNGHNLYRLFRRRGPASRVGGRFEHFSRAELWHGNEDELRHRLGAACARGAEGNSIAGNAKSAKATQEQQKRVHAFGGDFETLARKFHFSQKDEKTKNQKKMQKSQKKLQKMTGAVGSGASPGGGFFGTGGGAGGSGNSNFGFLSSGGGLFGSSPKENSEGNAFVENTVAKMRDGSSNIGASDFLSSFGNRDATSSSSSDSDEDDSYNINAHASGESHRREDPRATGHAGYGGTQGGEPTVSRGNFGEGGLPSTKAMRDDPVLSLLSDKYRGRGGHDFVAAGNSPRDQPKSPVAGSAQVQTFGFTPRQAEELDDVRRAFSLDYPNPIDIHELQNCLRFFGYNACPRVVYEALERCSFIAANCGRFITFTPLNGAEYLEYMMHFRECDRDFCRYIFEILSSPLLYSPGNPEGDCDPGDSGTATFLGNVGGATGGSGSGSMTAGGTVSKMMSISTATDVENASPNLASFFQHPRGRRSSSELRRGSGEMRGSRRASGDMPLALASPLVKAEARRRTSNTGLNPSAGASALIGEVLSEHQQNTGAEYGDFDVAPTYQRDRRSSLQAVCLFGGSFASNLLSALECVSAQPGDRTLLLKALDRSRIPELRGVLSDLDTFLHFLDVFRLVLGAKREHFGFGREEAKLLRDVYRKVFTRDKSTLTRTQLLKLLRDLGLCYHVRLMPDRFQRVLQIIFPAAAPISASTSPVAANAAGGPSGGGGQPHAVTNSNMPSTTGAAHGACAMLTGTTTASGPSAPAEASLTLQNVEHFLQILRLLLDADEHVEYLEEREAAERLQITSDEETLQLREVYQEYVELADDRPFVGLFAVKQMLKVGLEMRLSKAELRQMRELFERHAIAWKRDDGRETSVLTFSGFLRFLNDVLTQDFAGILQKCVEAVEVTESAPRVTTLREKDNFSFGGDSDSEDDMLEAGRGNRMFTRTKTDGSLLNLRRVSVKVAQGDSISEDEDEEDDEGSFMTSSLQLGMNAKRQSTTQYTSPASFLKHKLPGDGTDMKGILKGKDDFSALAGSGAGISPSGNSPVSNQGASQQPTPTKRVSMFMQHDMAADIRRGVASLLDVEEEEEEKDITAEEFLEWYWDEIGKIAKKRNLYQKRLGLIRERGVRFRD
ncbi:unnamed protein product [Amoebophrya sp. A25]|nr:unnamed protein product [Amoebophrya sp. A25]|eukprot:GSA25T00001954001.1